MNNENTNTFEINHSEPVLAVFYLQTDSSNCLISSFPHFKLKLANTDHLEISDKIIHNINDSIPILITIETWDEKLQFTNNNNPDLAITKGYYDTIIKDFCLRVIGDRPNIYIRLNPEMEVPAKRFPWQYKGLNVNSFKHVSELFSLYAPQVKLVWGPAGYPGVMDYYPGDNFTDAASVTLKSNSELDLDAYPKNYSVDYDLYRRLHRLRFIDKPIFVLGSDQIKKDSVSKLLISKITDKIKANRQFVYTKENLQRPDPKNTIIGDHKLEIGLYDPKSKLNSEESITVEHVFSCFRTLVNGTFENKFNEVIERGHDVIVTFEPSKHPDVEIDPNILQNIVNGKYDSEISQLYSIILSTDSKVYLRFAHEMEIPITRYPWQSQDPIDYINSFRYFMTFPEKIPSNIKRIWGPAGDRGSIEWWPGNDVVDYVSIAIYGLPDKDITDPNKQESFAKIFHRKAWRMRLIDKPIFITEFGVMGPKEFKAKWLTEAAKVIRENNIIIGINYFNLSDLPKVWGDIDPPDWSISKNTFEQFIDALSMKESDNYQ